MNFQSWVKNRCFFAIKSEILKFSKKIFCFYVVLIETYKMYINNVWLRSTILPGGQKTVFALFWGLKRGNFQFLPPGWTEAKNFFPIMGG